MNEHRCENCSYFRGRKLENGDWVQNECRRFPPVATTSGRSGKGTGTIQSHFEWVTINAFEWCGEFFPKSNDSNVGKSDE